MTASCKQSPYLKQSRGGVSVIKKEEICLFYYFIFSPCTTLRGKTNKLGEKENMEEKRMNKDETSRYELKATRLCGDATYNYDVIADYPIIFDEFWRNVVKIDGSWRVVFHCKNKYGKLYGEIWCGDDVELRCIKGKTYLDNKEDRELWENMKKEVVVGCWANGGWGQMTYYVTFKEEKKE